MVAPWPYALKNARVAALLAASSSGVGTQVISVSLLFTLMYSRLEKNCILSFLTGPPMLYPVWFRLNWPLSMLLATLSTVLFASASLLKKL